MSPPAFIEQLKANSTAALAIMAFFAAIIAFLTAVTGAGSAIGILLAVSFVLIVYNGWRFKLSKQPDRGPAWQETSRERKVRHLIHVASIVFLLLSWSVVAAFFNDHAAIALFRHTVGCKWIIERIKPKLADKDGLDFYEGRTLADCFAERNDPSQELEVLESLKTSRRGLAALPVEQRPFNTGLVDARIALDRLSENPGFDAAAALDSLRGSARMDPNNPAEMALYAYALAWALSTNRKSLSIVAEYDALIARLNEQTPQLISEPNLEYFVHYWVGRSLLAASRHLDAKLALEKALRIAEENLDLESQDRARSWLGKAEYSISFNMEAAAKWWEKITTSDNLADELNFQALVIVPKLDEAKKTNDEATLQSLLQKMQNLADESARLGSEGTRNQRLCDAIIDYYRKRYDDASKLFRSLVEREPNDIAFRAWLAKSMREAAKFADAEKEYAKLVELDHDDYAHLYNLAQTQVEQQHLVDAEKTSRRALLINSTDPSIPLQLAAILAQEAHNDNDFATKSKRFEEALGLVQSAKQLCAEEERYKGILAAAKAVRSNILNNLAFAYAGAAINLELANGYADESLEESPDNPDYLDTKAYVLIARSRILTDQNRRFALLSDAENLLKSSLQKLPPSDWSARAAATTHLALVSSLLGKKDDAIRDAHKALELDPANEEAKQLLQQ